MMSPRTKTLLPTAASLLKPKTTYDHNKRLSNKLRQKLYYDQQARDLQPLSEGDSVRMKPFQKGVDVWKKAVVTRQLDERSYEIQSADHLYRRNRVHLKPARECNPTLPTLSESQQDSQTSPVSQSAIPNAPETPRVSPKRAEATPAPVVTPAQASGEMRTRSGRSVRQPARFRDN